MNYASNTGKLAFPRQRWKHCSGWKEKKHGAHSLRHSLASNLLKKNVSIPIISTVLGHQQTETTKAYMKVDTENLKSCTLKMPELTSPYYANGGSLYE